MADFNLEDEIFPGIVSIIMETMVTGKFFQYTSV